MHCILFTFIVHLKIPYLDIKERYWKCLKIDMDDPHPTLSPAKKYIRNIFCIQYQKKTIYVGWCHKADTNDILNNDIQTGGNLKGDNQLLQQKTFTIENGG